FPAIKWFQTNDIRNMTLDLVHSPIIVLFKPYVPPKHWDHHIDRNPCHNQFLPVKVPRERHIVLIPVTPSQSTLTIRRRFLLSSLTLVRFQVVFNLVPNDRATMDEMEHNHLCTDEHRAR